MILFLLEKQFVSSAETKFSPAYCGNIDAYLSECYDNNVLFCAANLQ